MSEHPQRGVYLDECAPHFRVKAWHVAALLVSLLLWIGIIVAAVAIYRLVRGGG